MVATKVMNSRVKSGSNPSQLELVVTCSGHSCLTILCLSFPPQIIEGEGLAEGLVQSSSSLILAVIIPVTTYVSPPTHPPHQVGNFPALLSFQSDSPTLCIFVTLGHFVTCLPHRRNRGADVF